MFRRIFWKLSISLVIVIWALLSLYPLKNRPFPDYLKGEVTARNEEFGSLMSRAAERVQAKEAQSIFVALKRIANEEKIDLSQFFPHINLERSLRNVEKRNNILLDEMLKRSQGQLQLGLDLKGGVAFTLEVTEQATDSNSVEREEKLSKAIEIISTRINALGVSEPVVRAIGDNRIEVQLPDVSTKDNPDVVDAVKKPARLDFRLVHPFLTPEAGGGDTPVGYEVMELEHEGKAGEIVTEEVFVKRIPDMTGEGVSDSFPMMDEFGRFRIILRFTDDGKERFANVTGAIADEGRRTGRTGRLAIVLDGKLYSAPTVRERIDSDSAEITGSFTQREAFELANVLNNPLDVPLEIKEQYEVGSSLAGDAVSSAKLAFIIGVSLTIVFILAFYTLGGLVAAIGMTINVIVVLAVMANIDATLTLPGIAGIVLTLAMSVDANILIFERMKEELKLGKSLAASLEAGFEKAWSAILDGNITTLITAAIMWAMGTGPVKGFGVTLTIGIFTTMFAAVVVTKLLLEILVHSGTFKRIPMFSVLQDTKIDFLKYARPAFMASWVVVLIGIGVVVYKGGSIYGIDFTGGDSVTLSFEKKVELESLRKAANAAGFMDATPVYQRQIGAEREVLKITTTFDSGEPLVAALQQAFPDSKFSSEGVSRIGPSIGEEIQWNAMWSLIIALLLILVYVAFRFEFGYGVGAVVCTIHDLLMTVGIFVLFDRQFNASMVAAILLVAGYSINDTIVVFDRIREELKINPVGSLRELINRALNLTLSRTLITGGTTLLTAITLIVVTSGEVNDIAFTLLIGVLVGTFSSLFIACPVFFWWHKGDRKHVEAHHDLAPKYEWEGSSKASQ
jgi:SecD/SecF fusion protein